jgi:hypothetical protein
MIRVLFTVLVMALCSRPANSQTKYLDDKRFWDNHDFNTALERTSRENNGTCGGAAPGGHCVGGLYSSGSIGVGSGGNFHDPHQLANEINRIDALLTVPAGWHWTQGSTSRPRRLQPDNGDDVVIIIDQNSGIKKHDASATITNSLLELSNPAYGTDVESNPVVWRPLGEYTTAALSRRLTLGNQPGVEEWRCFLDSGYELNKFVFIAVNDNLFHRYEKTASEVLGNWTELRQRSLWAVRELALQMR